MENIATNIDRLYQQAKQYSNTSLEIVKLKAVDKVSDMVSSLAVSLIMVLIVALFSLFLNIGIAMWIGKTLENYAVGFFIVSSFYLVVGIIVYAFRKTIIKDSVDNFVIKKLLTSDSRGNDTKETN
jgi:hypothetical protein